MLACLRVLASAREVLVALTLAAAAAPARGVLVPQGDGSVPAGRPVGLEQSLSTAHFRIHFTARATDAPRGWPEQGFLREAAEACERAWRVCHEEMPWPVPPGDAPAGGDDLVDVYLRDLGPRIYGYSLPEEPAGHRGAAGFIVADNDYAGTPDIEPLDALRVTLAHEYAHLIQYGFGVEPEIHWFMEQTATMMESRIQPQISDSHRYLEDLGAHPYSPLDLCNGAFEYGAWLWPQFICEQPGGDAMLVAAWHRWAQGGVGMLDALDAALAPCGGLESAFREWTIWNAFLGDADDGAHYRRGSAYPSSIRVERAVSEYPTEEIRPRPLHQPAPLGASYIEFCPQRGSADNRLVLAVRSCEPVREAVLIIWRERDARPEILRAALDGGNGDVEIQSWDTVLRMWLVLANGPQATSGCAYTVAAETHYRAAGVDDEVWGAGGVALRVCPNPWEASTIFGFRLAVGAPVLLRVLDAQGRVVDTLFDGPCSSGEHAVRWGAAGNRAPAGLYFAEMRMRGQTQRARLVRLR